MQPVNFEGAVIIKSNGEENCNHIYAQPVEIPLSWQEIQTDGSIEQKEGVTRIWRELWKPSIKDLQNLIAGSGIWLELHCSQLTPVAMYTTDETGNVEEPKFDENLKPD